MFAPDFCEGWVARHLLDAELSRLRDELIPDPLPFAVVRCTQTEWDKIALELINRGVATVMEPEHIATCRGEPILHGAFGVVKPNKWVGSPADNCPVLRLIMDFRAANAAHRMLPGSVSSLVGAAKWQGFCLDKKEVLVTSGDDLVAAFYLFRLPFSWSRYFTFRKPTTRGALHLDGDPQAKVFIASQVLPMGWAAAVTIMQHIHRRVALWGGGLPQEREIHRERALPEKLTSEVSSYWNLYVDDLSVMEIVAEDWAASQSQEEPDLPELQRKMQQAYLELGVPFSKEKSTMREVACEKLGALIHGKRGVLGVTTARALDFVTLALYMMSCEKVPTRWFQIFLGKFVHIVQFRRPMFSMVEASWRRLQNFHGAGPMTSEEIDEWFRLCMALPLAYTDLRARVAHRVTCSDASPSGGGLCYSVGLTPLGELGSRVSRPRGSMEAESYLSIEWFAGIGGMARSLERLGLRTHQAAVCELDADCLGVLRGHLPGCQVWKDIRAVSEEDIRMFFDRYPDARGVVQSGGSPCQGLSKLSSERQHFEDERSGLFFELVRVMALVQAEAVRRGMWHFGFVENVVCDPEDQRIFREMTGWGQFLICSGTMSHVRRPRFYWISEAMDFSEVGFTEPGVGYTVVHLVGPKEDPAWWVSPGWTWVSALVPCSLPTFTRSIPRSKPPPRPAGLQHTPSDAVSRWRLDSFRYPPYTYKKEFCMEKENFFRVACAAEREALMGFSPGHTRDRKRKISEDVRCSMLGNSFHTGVVSVLLKVGLQKHFARLSEVKIDTLAEKLASEWSTSQKEIFSLKAKSACLEDDEAWLDRLEQQSEAVARPLSTKLSHDGVLVNKLLELVSYRGTDVHVDTHTFYRPDHLPKASVDARQWRWRVARGWKWKYPDHINILEMEALYHSVRWRAKSLKLFHKRFVHLVDSQVVLGVAAKGRTSSSRLHRSLHKYNLLILSLHVFPILGWVMSHLNPADEPSRWYEEHPS